MTNGKKHRIQIKVPAHYKPVNDEVWEELETYLFSGFLTSPATILKRAFIFKTLNHHEIRNLSFFRPLDKSIPELQIIFRATFISHSIFCIDGENILPNRTDHIKKLNNIICKIDTRVQEEILENLQALNQKATRLHPLVEAYTYENRSRFKWLQFRDSPIHHFSSTGISGTDELGMNYCQQMWVALNRLEDNREQLEADWTNAKFIGSCFAGKSIRSIDERDKARKEKEREKREDLKMKVLYEYLNRGIKKEEDKLKEQVVLPDGRTAKVEKRFLAESAEELADQLSAALSGEKDHHDRVIEQTQQKNKKLAERIRAYRQQLYQRPDVVTESAQASSTPISGPSRILGGHAEARKHLDAHRALDKLRIAQYRKISLDLESERMAKSYQRIAESDENSDKR